MSSGKEDIDTYISNFEGTAKKYLSKIRQLVLEVAPDAEELINYDIPAFSLIKGGKREEQIMIAGYKKHVGFYPHPTTMEQFWEKLDGYKKAKGSVQFPLSSPLPENLIKEMIIYRRNTLTGNNS